MPSDATVERTDTPNEQQITLTLTAEMSERVRAEIAEHGYETPLDVLQDALRLLDPNPDTLAPWMEQEIIAACDELDADPTGVRTMEQVKEMLAAEYDRAVKAGW